MAQKKIMLLGGLRYLLPVIEAAHNNGYYVITCDYLPDNIAHKYSDEYVNVSIIDKDAVLKVAIEKEIDGIMSFAVDPGVVTAAYVQEKMGLPAFGPYESVRILQNKDLFREFLTKNGFKVPKAKGYSNTVSALKDTDWITYPCIVKPTDAAGSKGVSRVDSFNQLKEAIEYAFKYSITGKIIIEDFIEKKGCSSDSDCFSLNGELKFVSFSSQRFDEHAAGVYTPAAYSWPSTYSKAEEEELTNEIQRLLKLLKMNTSIYNIETRVSTDGIPYIMEVSPRGGGNRLAEMVRFSTGVDLINACVRAAVGDSVLGIEQKSYDGHWAEVVLHADKDGIFDRIEIDDSKYKFDIIEKDIWVKSGDEVKAFTGANNAIGTLVLKFGSESLLLETLAEQPNWLRVLVK